jgi:hypothetical protein
MPSVDRNAILIDKQQANPFSCGGFSAGALSDLIDTLHTEG